jgi:HEAT repeat protein
LISISNKDKFEKDASMNKLRDYKDYVNHLSHENRLVRRWAFKALENHYANRYTDEVCSLINDEDEHLACAAPRYLAQHEAVQHAPAILESFKSSQGIIPSNCASALAKMYYEPAIDVMLEHFINPGSAETFLGILDYLGEIHHEKCRDALKSAVFQVKDTFLLGSAMANLLRHYNSEDVKLVLDKYFESGDRNNRNDMLLKNISSPLGGGSYFRDLTEFGQNNILLKPVETINGLTLKNSHIEMDEILRKNMIMSLEKGQYEDFVTMIMFDSRNIVNARYPKNNCPDFLSELFDQDRICISFLEDLSKRSTVWKQVKHSKELGANLIPLIISAYFAIKERKAYQKALYPEAGIEELIQAVKNTGSLLPMQIQKKIKELSPISELKAALTNDLMTWGDIWVVRIMGQIGNKDFVSDLIRVLRNSDSMDYIYSDALRAIDTLDESADKSILTAIKNQELGDWESFPILEHLPYSEAYDLALHRWENESGDMDSYEIFSFCLRGIGDRRGIEKLQDIYANENNAVYIGDSLECLGEIHTVDVPELPDIIKRRKELDERQKDREKELNELAKNYREEKEPGALENRENIVPFKRDTPKVGRNAPCPCGSGKKYKKCCLNKIN